MRCERGKSEIDRGSRLEKERGLFGKRARKIAAVQKMQDIAECGLWAALLGNAGCGLLFWAALLDATDWPHDSLLLQLGIWFSRYW